MAALVRTVGEVAAFLAAQPPTDDPVAVHWLDEESTRLAEQVPVRKLQAIWHERHDEAFDRPVADMDPVDREAVRLYRTVIAMAIAAKICPAVLGPEIDLRDDFS